MKLAEIICQDRAIDVLQSAVHADRIAHSYIFTGPDGIGKFLTAQAFAQMLMCENRQTTEQNGGPFHDACGQCPSCRLFDAETHPDLKIITKELYKFTEKGKNSKAESVELRKDVIDRYLVDDVHFRPNHGAYKVYIIREAERLNRSSQNAMLKALEEPPDYCKIVLLCTSLEQMLPTIRSRCQVIPFGSIDEPIIVDKLRGEGVGANAARYFARLCRGSIGEAMFWAAVKDDTVDLYALKQRIVAGICTCGLPKAVDFAAFCGESAKSLSGAIAEAQKEKAQAESRGPQPTDEIAETDEPALTKKDVTRKCQKQVLNILMSVFQDIQSLHVGKAASGWINHDQPRDIQGFAQNCTLDQAAANIQKIYENIKWVDDNVNEKLIFEELLLHIGGCGTIST